MRRAAVLAIVLLVLVTACSALDETVVHQLPSGQVLVENCGTWIEGIEVRDARTDEVLWAVQGPPSTSVGSVIVGKTPRGWREGVRFESMTSVHLDVSVLTTYVGEQRFRLPQPADGELDCGTGFDLQIGWSSIVRVVAMLAGAAAVAVLAVRVSEARRRRRAG